MPPADFRIEVYSGTHVLVYVPQDELGRLTHLLSEAGLLAMRQFDCVAIEGSWKDVLNALRDYDPCLETVVEQTS